MTRRMLALILGCCLAFAACGGSDDDTPAAGGGSDTTEGGGQEEEEPEEGALDETAVFRYAYSVDPISMDPHKASRGFDNIMLTPVYDRLIHVTSETELVPGLATEWELTDTSLTLTLREGVKFSDGTPFDAAAVKANLDRAKALEGSIVAPLLTSVANVVVEDPTTVVLELSAPNSSLPAILSDKAGMMISPAALDNPDLDRMPVGAGMFEVVEYVPGNIIRYEPVEDYWDPDAVKVAGLEILLMPDETARLNAVRTGEVDATWLNAPMLAEAEAAGLKVDATPGASYVSIVMDRSQPPFDDPRVREAMNLAVDREAILEGIFFGVGEPTVQIFPEKSPYYNADYPASYFERDVERAKELLTEAGYPDGFSYEQIVANVAPYPQVVEALQAQLAEAGITLTPRMVSAQESTDLFFRQSQGQGFTVLWSATNDPSVSIQRKFTGKGNSNRGAFSLPAMEELYSSAVASTDEAERTELLQEISGTVVEENLEIILLFTPKPIVYREGVVGFSIFATDHQEFRGVGVLAD